ncbi:MAG: nuclear transport factor 2 family protein [Acidobacteria bacterium]|nr:nuclear transport factor 2 family protein [Acidobacteriota bacterium]
MLKRFSTLLVCVLILSVGLAAAPKKSGPGPDKAYLQKIWDGWGSLDIEKQGQFYAQGPHVFFDVAPLQYASWDEFRAGVSKELANFKSATFTVNDDAQLHPKGDMVWGTATVKMDATLKSGKRELATFRWTFVMEKQEGKWLLVHEHVSQPAE